MCSQPWSVCNKLTTAENTSTSTFIRKPEAATAVWRAPDDGHCNVRNMLSSVCTTKQWILRLMHLVGCFIWGLCELCFCRGNSLICIWNKEVFKVCRHFLLGRVSYYTHCDMSCLQIEDSYKQQYTVESQSCEPHCSGCWHCEWLQWRHMTFFELTFSLLLLHRQLLAKHTQALSFIQWGWLHS